MILVLPLQNISEEQKERKINMKKRVLTLLMALAMIASLAACSGSKSPAGTYQLAKISSGGEEMDVQEMTELFGMEIDMSLELKDDKSFTWNLGFWGDGEDASGNWKMEGDTLILTAEGEELPVTYDGKTITMDLEGELFTFEKK